MTPTDTNNNVEKQDSSEGESTPLMVDMSYRVVEQEDPSELHQLPEPTLWASRISLFLVRAVLGRNHHAASSLRTAWSFFEYMILPRRAPTVREDDGKTRYVKAAPGRHIASSTLYPAWTTPVRQLRDFGTGVAVYFETLLSLAIVCLVAGLLYLPSMHHYATDGYQSQHVRTVLGPLGGSLICPDPVWAPCLDCTADQWRESPARYGSTTPGDGGVDGTEHQLVFALKNTCAPLRWQEGLNHLAVMVFLAMAMFALGWYQKRLELHYDEDVLTASDFSIQVDNPPEDATDPNEWKEFFQQFGPVAYVTVALNNAELLKKLQQRRAALLKAKYVVNVEYQNKPLDSIPKSLETKKPKLHQELTKLEKECRHMMQKKTFPTSGIFVTFDKEADQRRCLKALQVGQYNVINNNLDVLQETSHRFRGNLVLDVMEPTEPSAIRWQDLDESMSLKIQQRVLTTILSVGVIVVGFWLVSRAYRNYDIGTAAFGITLLNIVMPHVFKAINSLEAHQYEDSYQASLYWKITIFRWVNTALVTILIKPFPETLADSKGSLVASVQAVLKAEIVIAPVVHLLDIGGFVKRMILAPRAPDQSSMNALFHGAKVNLGEKYCNATKTVFLVFFYSAIFPPGFFYGAMALFLTYITDKFLLLRSWGPMPRVRDAVARISRKIFFPLTVVFLAVMSEFFFSAYPCDDLCDTDRVVDSASAYQGNHELTLLDGTTVSVTVAADVKIYRFCDQDFSERLPALTNLLFQERRDWMSGAQESLSWVFGLFAACIIGLIVFVNLRDDVTKARTEVYGGFSTDERDSGESYSKQKKIHAYIPQVSHKSFAFPLIAADLSMFDSQHLGWKDPFLDYSHYNLQRDVESIDAAVAANKPILSRVYQFESKLC